MRGAARVRHSAEGKRGTAQGDSLLVPPDDDKRSRCGARARVSVSAQHSKAPVALTADNRQHHNHHNRDPDRAEAAGRRGALVCALPDLRARVGARAKCRAGPQTSAHEPSAHCWTDTAAAIGGDARSRARVRLPLSSRLDGLAIWLSARQRAAPLRQPLKRVCVAASGRPSVEAMSAADPELPSPSGRTSTPAKTDPGAKSARARCRLAPPGRSGCSQSPHRAHASERSASPAPARGRAAIGPQKKPAPARQRSQAVALRGVARGGWRAHRGEREVEVEAEHEVDHVHHAARPRLARGGVARCRERVAWAGRADPCTGRAIGKACTAPRNAGIRKGAGRAAPLEMKEPAGQKQSPAAVLPTADRGRSATVGGTVFPLSTRSCNLRATHQPGMCGSRAGWARRQMSQGDTSCTARRAGASPRPRRCTQSPLDTLRDSVLRTAGSSCTERTANLRWRAMWALGRHS
jgi:hypothetical protein